VEREEHNESLVLLVMSKSRFAPAYGLFAIFPLLALQGVPSFAKKCPLLTFSGSLKEKMSDSRQLLAEYANGGSEAAFRELVIRYVDLVYSAAVRLVNNDTHLAEDVTQTVFADLARMARSLSPNVTLGGWLHRHTCFVASKTMRRERRRQLREQEAAQMNSSEDHSAAQLAAIAPLLDEAINQLGAVDRTAILLRFFEQRDFRSVGEALGSNEEAARKRVNRALEKLQTLLHRRGIALSAGALGAALATQAVSAAPAGLAAGITASALAGAATANTTTLTILKIMSLTTKLKIGIGTAILAAVIAVPLVIQHQSKTKLEQEKEALQRQVQKMDQLAAENERLSRLTAAVVPAAPAQTNEPSREVLKLRGEVGRLRQEQAADAANKTNGPSPLSSLTATPEMTKMIRDQQKAGMTMIYRGFVKSAKLSPELSEKFGDLLADNVMTNIAQITAVLRDGKTGEQFEKAFADVEAAMQEKAQALLGPEAYAQYQDYSRNLASHLTSEQFKPMLTGEKEQSELQAKQLYQAMQEETQIALANAGLSPDFQTVPILNFRNIASEAEAEKNLKLLEGIYERVTVRAGSFLDAESLKKFEQFQAKALAGNRMSLAMNRKMMAPGAK
jgi:RNA polymerase sigma factor (sigma-70 family)